MEIGNCPLDIRQRGSILKESFYMDPLAQRAIRAALEGKWTEAEKINREIVKNSPKDIDALNRLARAQAELGKISPAQTTYKKVLKLDSHNTIAKRALERLGKSKRSKKAKKAHSHPVDPSFIEEPGKTKTVSLIHLGSKEIVDSLDTGQPVVLVPHAHRVSVQTEEGNYIGRLPDDLSRRIIKFAKAGNEYKTLIRSVNDAGVRIFIRETKRAPALADVPSFPSNEKAGYISFTPPDLVYEEKPEMTSLEEEEE